MRRNAMQQQVVEEKIRQPFEFPEKGGRA